MWLRKGIIRYNDLINVVRRIGNTAHSKEMEMELTWNCAKLCGKYRGRNGNGVLSEADVSDDDNLEVYDGFAGVDAGTGVVLCEV